MDGLMRLSRDRRAYALHEEGRARAFEDESGGAAAQCGVDILVQVEGRHDDDACRTVGSGELPGDLEAVPVGHTDVHQRHVWAQPMCHVDGGEPVGGFS